jgi:hypothetical protein
MRINQVPKLTPKGPSTTTAKPNVKWLSSEGFNWNALIASSVHPARVAVIEALTWVDRPLSRGQLEQLFFNSCSCIRVARYHVGMLHKLGVLEVVDDPEGDSSESFYRFSGSERGSDRSPQP